MRRLLPIAILVAFFDQLTKILVLRWVDPAEPVEVIDGWFRLVSWTNTGAAWGIFPNANFVLAIVSVLTLIALYFFRHGFQVHRVGSQVALGLISGGIVGNVVDRFRYGHVVDFLDFSYGAYHWPAFNVADSAICVGVGLYVVISARRTPSA